MTQDGKKGWQSNAMGKKGITVDRYLKYADIKEKALTELVQRDAGVFRRVKLKGEEKSLYFRLNSEQVYIVIH